jgi:hypothetical protein
LILLRVVHVFYRQAVNGLKRVVEIVSEAGGALLELRVREGGCAEMRVFI